MLLNNEWVNNVIKEEVKIYLEKNENEDIPPQNLGNTGKAFLRGKFIALEAHFKEQNSQINNLTLHIKILGKKTQTE